MAKEQNLIEFLVENYFQNEAEAQEAVKLGVVSVNNKLIKRPGITVCPAQDKIKVIGNSKIFVSRGGYKLQRALELFGLDVKERICLDIGSSTGGFTDCLLQYGASEVYSIDTGYGQLAWKLRKDPRVHCMERTNVRYLLPEKLYTDENKPKASFVAIDVSFISAIKLLPPIQNLTKGPDETEFAILIKPQFEAGKNKVGKGGLVRNPEIHFEILNEFCHSMFRTGLDLKGLTHSPLLGASGNLEFLAHAVWTRRGYSLNPNLENWLKDVIKIAYTELHLN